MDSDTTHPTSPLAAATDREPGLSHARILIVEDEWVIADDLRLTLEHDGHTVTAVVSSGEAAVARRCRPWDR